MAEGPVSGHDVGPIGRRSRRLRLRQLWYVLLLFAVIVVLVPSIYARITPKVFGIPFFYWFQMAWIIVTMILTAVVYAFTTDRDTEPSDAEQS